MFKLFGNARRAGVTNNVATDANPIPQISDQARRTKKYVSSLLYAIVLSKTSKLIWSADGSRPVIVVIVVKKIGLILFLHATKIAS